MAYKGYITTLKNVRPHSNANKLKLADCFGNTVCVGLNATEGEVVLYLPCDGQLSAEYCEYNNLVRKKDENGNNVGGYLDPDKRNVKAIKLRGEKSDGIVMPLSSLAYTGVDINSFKVGDTIDVVNGHEICRKYIPRKNVAQHNVSKYGSKVPRIKTPIAPLFKEHADTEQLAYNLDAFKPGDEIEITLKMHGTSQRTGYLPVLKGYKRTLLDKVFRREGTPVYEWGYVSGTRRTVLENYDGGYYGSNEFREQHSKIFEGKLWKGETVYCEVVGFTNTGIPIMADGNNEKLGKDFVKQYGKTTTFSYGCEPNGCHDGELMKFATNDNGDKLLSITLKPQSDIYVYRMTMTNEDGDVVEYTPNFMRYRCEQMGIKTVPVMWKGTIPAYTADEAAIRLGQNAGAWIKEKAEEFYDGPDPVGKTHIREGVVVCILNRPKFSAYKCKNFSFKVLEGIIKETTEVPDIEEAEELEVEYEEKN